MPELFETLPPACCAFPIRFAEGSELVYSHLSTPKWNWKAIDEIIHTEQWFQENEKLFQLPVRH